LVVIKKSHIFAEIMKMTLLMQKRILILSGLCFMLMTAPVASYAMTMEMSLGIAEQVEQERQIIISMEGNAVNVAGAAGMTLEVVSITGRHVTSYKIDGSQQRIELSLPKGCYILKVGKVVRKVTLH